MREGNSVATVFRLLSQGGEIFADGADTRERSLVIDAVAAFSTRASSVTLHDAPELTKAECVYDAWVLVSFGQAMRDLRGLQCFRAPAVGQGPAGTHGWVSQVVGAGELGEWASSFGDFVELAATHLEGVSQLARPADPVKSSLFACFFDALSGGVDANAASAPLFSFERYERIAYRGAVRRAWARLTCTEPHRDVLSTLGIVVEEPAILALLDAQSVLPSESVFGDLDVGGYGPSGRLPALPLATMYVEPRGWRLRKPVGEEGGQSAPLFTILQEQLARSTHVIVVEQRGGGGKSLSAQMFAATLSDAARSDACGAVPVLLACQHGALGGGDRALWEMLHLLLSRSPRLCSAEMPELDALRRKEVVWIIDGVDELCASEEHVARMLEQAVAEGPQHRFVFLSRPSATRGFLEEVPYPGQHPDASLWGYVLIRDFDDTQRKEWLRKWENACEGSDLAPSQSWLQGRAMDRDFYTSPMLLLMGALTEGYGGGDMQESQYGNQAAQTKYDRERVRLYERFCSWVALGVWRTAMREERARPGAARRDHLQRLATHFHGHDGLPVVVDEQGVGPTGSDERQGASALLFALSAIAWRLVVNEQTRAGCLDGGQAITAPALVGALRRLGFALEEPAALDCLLVATHSAAHGTPYSFLFRHRTFVEYLAVRYHIAEFNRLAKSGAPASGDSDAAREVRESVSEANLLAVRNADACARSQVASFLDGTLGLPQLDQRSADVLHRWCARELEDEPLTFRGDGPPTLRAETRNLLRWCATRVAAATFRATQASPYWGPELDAAAVARFLRSRPQQGRGRMRPGAARAHFAGADLSGAHLGLADLRSATLRGADLACADLLMADLRGADLRDAELQDANLRNADLRGASLRGARLRRCALRHTNLSRADLRAAVFDEADLAFADLRGADFDGASLDSANLRSALLCGANLRGVCLLMSDCTRADLRGADLQGADLRDANLQGADLRDANLEGADLRGVNFSGIELRGANLSLSRYRLSDPGADLADWPDTAVEET